MRTCTRSRAASNALIATLLLLAGCSTAPGSIGPRVIATVTATVGAPNTIRKNQSYVLDQQSLIYEGDILQTKAAEKVQVVMIDNTIITLGPNSHLLFHEYSYREGDRGPRARLTLGSGTLLVDNPATQKSGRGKFAIQTPVATITVKGARFFGGFLFEPNTLDVALLRGDSVVIANAHGSTELTLPVSGTSVQGDRGPQPPSAWPDARRLAALDNFRL
ncbi:MAG: FecR domain-containing protein [Pseudomonadota bacterium]